MKNLINLIILFNIFIFISYAQQNNNYLKNPRKVIVTGKILHFNNNNSLKVDINRLSFEAKEIMPDVDGLGNFSFTFNSYIPSDITIHYGSYFYMVTHPGDSLHFVFDGQNKDLLKSIKFSGDASKSNQDLAAFQEMYFANSLYTNESIQINALKNYGEIKYLSFCDSMKTAKHELYKKYLANYSPDDEIKNWITTFLENDYYYSIAWYPEMHSEINQLKPNQFKASQGYYNKLNEMLPIKSSMLISTCAINGFLNYYYFIYVLNTTKKNYGKTTDSLLVASINSRFKCYEDRLFQRK
jgi:hypothetical protein